MRKYNTVTIASKLFASLIERKQFLIDNGFPIASEFKSILDHVNPDGRSYKQFLHAVENTKTIFDFEPLLKIAAKPKQSNGNDAQYIQMKSLEKVLKFTKAFGLKDFRILDNHSRSITINAMVNSGLISSKGAFATLVRCEFDALDSQDERLVARNNYTSGTGSTQLSSTRELFRMLGLCDSVKGERNAPIIFTDAAKTALIEHFEIIASKTNVTLDDQEIDENESSFSE